MRNIIKAIRKHENITTKLKDFIIKKENTTLSSKSFVHKITPFFSC